MTFQEWCDEQFLSRQQRDSFTSYDITTDYDINGSYDFDTWATLFVDYVKSRWHKKEDRK
jgi:hypothetical protein